MAKIREQVERFILIWIAFSLGALPAIAQDTDSLTQRYPPSLCSSCAEWNAPQDPGQRQLFFP